MCSAPWWPSLKPVTAFSTISFAWARTSTKMKARTPTENIASATRVRLPRSWSRPNGKPEEDGEAGEGAEGDGLGEGHGS